MRRLSVMVRTIPTSKINKNAYNGCFLHQNSESGFLICDKQTAEPLLLLVQKSLRSLHFLVSKNHPHKSVTLTPAEVVFLCAYNSLDSLRLFGVSDACGLGF